MGRSKSTRRRTCASVAPVDAAASSSINVGDVDMTDDVAGTVAKSSLSAMADTTIVSDGGTISSDSLGGHVVDGIDLNPDDTSLTEELEADVDSVDEAGDSPPVESESAPAAIADDSIATDSAVGTADNSASSGVELSLGEGLAAESKPPTADKTDEDSMYEAISLISEAGREVAGSSVGDGFVVDASVVSLVIFSLILLCNWIFRFYWYNYCWF